MREFGQNRPMILLHTDKWGVLPEEIDSDKYSFKDQPRHLVDWERLEPGTWLDFNYWKAQRQSRDMYPDWRLRLRDSAHSERVAQIIQCYFKCELISGNSKVFGAYGSRISEGDEITTGEDSYAWLMLVDGTLIRVSPNTSLSFNDVNMSLQKSQFYLRLNSGHIYIQPRFAGEFKTINLGETDGIFLPLLEERANREYYLRREFQNLLEKEQPEFELLSNPGHRSQYAELNKLVAPIEDAVTRDSEIILGVANTTLVSTNSVFEIFHGSFNNSIVKKYSAIAGFENKETGKEQKLVAYFRGYTNRESQEIEADSWQDIDREGKSMTSADVSSMKIKVVESLVRRIPSIHLAREYMLRKNYQFNFWSEKEWSEESLAVKAGFRLWNVADKEELQKRHDFLLEYIRRTETSILNSHEKLTIKARLGEFVPGYVDEAINQSIRYLKSRNNWKSPMIKEMTDSQYYVWMIKYGNKQYNPYASKCLAKESRIASLDLYSLSDQICRH